ncbi:MAG: exodeoxyribonuclease VII small subunit [Deltaproteobacteria bacterium]|nr:exodeoxyribonuclease VII small subunit [Deltaproteobacteria bacterium]
MGQKRFEEALKQLEEIVRDLESGDLSLEDSLKNFERGMKLIKFCSEKLEEVEQKVNILVKESDGKYSTQPFDFKEENGDL